MRSLVTGGTGFIGWNLAASLRKQGDDVTVIGLTETDPEHEKRQFLEKADIRFIPLAIDDPVEQWPSIGSVDTIFHLAAAQHRVGQGDNHFKRVNVDGTKHLLQFAIDQKVQRFVYASTIGVWGERAGILDETTPTEPDTIYGQTKLEAEQHVKDRSAEIETVIARLPETYGPGDHRLLKLFQKIQGGRVVVLGHGDNRHHPMFVDDLVAALRILADHPAAAGETFLLAGPEPLTTQQMMRSIASALGVDIQSLRHVPLWPFLLASPVIEVICKSIGIEPPLHRRRLGFFIKDQSLRTEKIKNLLGFLPTIGFSKGAERTVQWYRSQGLISAPAEKPAWRNDAQPNDRA